MADFPELSTPLVEKREPLDKIRELSKNGMSGASPFEDPEQEA